MSKMDDLRAMREARHAAGVARAASPARRAAPPVAPPEGTSEGGPAPRDGRSATSSGTEETTAVALCGHRNMAGRTCTREQGHAARSHRYG